MASIGAGAIFLGVKPTQDAIAQGGTRSLTIYHAHTKEQETITFKQSGSYDSAGLQKLNWLLRDWRMDEPIRMDPQLFDILWEVYRASGSSLPIHVVSAYRSPGTNAMLRRSSRGVAKNSQHMSGKAMDFNLPDVSMATVRDIGLRMQNGGVGYYPRANNPWVHLDTGGVRHWPKVSRDHLVRLFPDERTVHIPSDGKPLAGFEAARSIIEARGGSVSSGYIDIAEGRATGKTLFQILFGGGEGDDEGDIASVRGKKGVRTAVASRQRNQQVAALAPETTEPNALAFFNQNSTSTSAPARPDTPAAMASIRSRGPTRPTPLPEPKQAEPAAEVKREEPKREEPKREEPKQVEIAALQPRTVPVSTKAVDSEDDKARWVTIPLPQRRPRDLAPSNAPVLVTVALPQPRPVSLASLPVQSAQDTGEEAAKAPEPTKPPEAAKLAAILAPTRSVTVPLPQNRPAGLPNAITAGLRTGGDSAPTVLAYAPTSAPAAGRIVPAAPAAPLGAIPQAAPSAAPAPAVAATPTAQPLAPSNADRKSLNSLIAQTTIETSAAKGGRVSPQTVASVTTSNTVTGRFDASPKSDTRGFTGSVIRPLAQQGFKREE